MGNQYGENTPPKKSQSWLHHSGPPRRLGGCCGEAEKRPAVVKAEGVTDGVQLSWEEKKRIKLSDVGEDSTSGWKV